MPAHPGIRLDRRIRARLLVVFAAVFVVFPSVDTIRAQTPTSTPGTSEEPDSDTEGSAGEDAQAPQEPDPIDFPDPEPPLEQTPETNTEGPESGDPDVDPDVPAPDAAPAPTVRGPTPPTQTQGAPTAAPSASPVPEEPAAATPERHSPPARPRDDHRSAKPQRSRHAPPSAPRARQTAGPRMGHTAPRPAPTVPSQVSPRPDPTVRDPSLRGVATYVVRRGDSLWSIAQRRLGPNAENGEIADEVQHLWKLNAARIGTGDPDLLLAGQQLRLG